MNSTILFLPGGPTEIIVILLILVILFGPKKIPKLARSTGQAISELKRGKEEGLEEDENEDKEN
jgi:sec-independent protein translocase protein TatA